MSLLKKLGTVDSTNNWIRKNIDNLSGYDAVLARKQTAGKGRGDKKWFSPEGGLWLSILIDENDMNKGILSIICSVAIVNTLLDFNIEPSIKWPNDILINSRKIGGILIEKVNKKFITGIGLNLNIPHSKFPHNLQKRVSSLKEIINDRISIKKTARNIIKQIKKGAEEQEKFYATYLLFNQDLGKNVEIIINDRKIKGRVAGINNDGSIKIATSGKIKTYYSGSIKYI